MFALHSVVFSCRLEASYRICWMEVEDPRFSTDILCVPLLFQAGAQMMEVLGSELDHRLPPDWSGSPISMVEMLVWGKLQT